jgi:DNA-binding MarR family transcriptional regulator
LFAAAEHSGEILALVTRCRDWVLTQAQQIVACNTLHAGEERLSRWLLLCSQKLHTTTFVITKEQLAAMLGVRRTTLTLIAQRLVAKGLIKYRRGKITICDPARLREAGCECWLGLACTIGRRSEALRRISRLIAVGVDRCPLWVQKRTFAPG